MTEPPTSLLGPLDGSHDRANRHFVCQQPLGLQDHLVLFDEPSDWCDFGDIWDGSELVTQIPILKTAQARQVLLRRHERRAIQRTAARFLKRSYMNQ